MPSATCKLISHRFRFRWPPFLKFKYFECHFLIKSPVVKSFGQPCGVGILIHISCHYDCILLDISRFVSRWRCWWSAPHHNSYIIFIALLCLALHVTLISIFDLYICIHLLLLHLILIYLSSFSSFPFFLRRFCCCNNFFGIEMMNWITLHDCLLSSSPRLASLRPPSASSGQAILKSHWLNALSTVSWRQNVKWCGVWN